MIKKIWGSIKAALEPISKVMDGIVNFALLSIAYFIGIGIVSLAAKIFGKHFLDIKKHNKKSNWQAHKIEKEPLEKYYRTF